MTIILKKTDRVYDEYFDKQQIHQFLIRRQILILFKHQKKNGKGNWNQQNTYSGGKDAFLNSNANTHYQEIKK